MSDRSFVRDRDLELPQPSAIYCGFRYDEKSSARALENFRGRFLDGSPRPAVTGNRAMESKR